jgi:hypothetical protein
MIRLQRFMTTQPSCFDSKRECPPRTQSAGNRIKHFAFNLHDIVRREPIPNYRLDIRRGPFDRELLIFSPLTTDPLERAV